jgi:hypothetical protein
VSRKEASSNDGDDAKDDDGEEPEEEEEELEDPKEKFEEGELCSFLVLGVEMCVDGKSDFNGFVGEFDHKVIMGLGE